MDESVKEYLSRIGSKGGKQTSEAKRAATRQTLAKARADKEFYKRNPSAHPKNRPPTNP